MSTILDQIDYKNLRRASTLNSKFDLTVLETKASERKLKDIITESYVFFLLLLKGYSLALKGQPIVRSQC